MSVLLPAPFGPARPNTSPRVQLEREVLQRAHLRPVRLRYRLPTWSNAITVPAYSKRGCERAGEKFAGARAHVEISAATRLPPAAPAAG